MAITGKSEVPYQGVVVGGIEELSKNLRTRYQARPVGAGRTIHDTFEGARDRVLFEAGLVRGASSGVELAIKYANPAQIVEGLRRRMADDPITRTEILMVLAEYLADEPDAGTR
jgi:hypothetical protein